MATRTNQQEGGSPSGNNPIAHAVFEARDLFGVETTGGGGKELVPVTPELRGSLRQALAAAVPAIDREAAANPGIPSVLILKLREIAIAKSHRPATLAYEANMPPVGHGELDEMLLAADAGTARQLDQIIASRNTKSIRANLSAVQTIEVWDAQRRLPQSLRGLPLEQLRDRLLAGRRRLMIRLFSDRLGGTASVLVERARQLLEDANLPHTQLEQRFGPPLFFVTLPDNVTIEVLSRLLGFQGIRQVTFEPHVWPEETTTASSPAFVPRFTAAAPLPDLPHVAVFDTGVAPTATVLAPWVSSRDIHVLPPETDYVHGTAVSSLIVDSSGLNGAHDLFPVAPCLIHDVCALEVAGARISDLIERLRAAIQNRPDIKVWNLSLGAHQVVDNEFSVFGRELDALSDTYGVLFVVAAGNYTSLPRRGWPASDTVLTDRISSPGDSVRALTVGSVAHLDDASSLVRAGEPAPYSRRGPGPVFTPKPDIVHLGGNADVNLSAGSIGVHVLSPGNGFTCGIGTSYAAPIASAMAAHTWHALATPGRSQALDVTPTLVKALLVHSAQLNSPARSVHERRYYGAGIPTSPASILKDSDSSFTVLFELDIADGMKWRKAPFPIPPSLLRNGKLNCEVVMTAAYAPPLAPAAGAEYIRFNVDVGFGTLDPDDEGNIQFKSQVPSDGELGTTGYELAQIEHGGKWSPIKTYRRAFPRGKAGGTWALQATVVRRAFEPALTRPLRVVVIVTLRALDGNPHVYAEGQRQLAATNWVTQNLSTTVPVRISS